MVSRKDGIGSLLRKLNLRGQWLRAVAVAVAGVVCTAVAARIVGCGEELGWRGWLLPRLMSRYNPAVATAIVAAIWGCWHAFILLSGAQTAAIFLFGVFGLSFLFTALWQRVKGNIFVLAVAHASVNAPLSVLNQQSVTDAVFVLYGALGLVAAILIAVRNR